MASVLPRHQGRRHAHGARSPVKNIASVAFGGADLRSVYLGKLVSDGIAGFPAPPPALHPGNGAAFKPQVGCGGGSP